MGMNFDSDSFQEKNLGKILLYVYNFFPCL